MEVEEAGTSSDGDGVDRGGGGGGIGERGAIGVLWPSGESNTLEHTLEAPADRGGGGLEGGGGG